MSPTPPDHYRHTGETAISNFDRSIAPGAADSLRSGEIVMDYAAWNFHGVVWYCREQLKFCCEVSRHGHPVGTVTADTLEDIRELASDSHGQE